ncbi:MAG: hypothetical protein RMK84_09140 [Oscillochloridaceae bacterium]|nr:hypothetical protein [Chloroflexaceae bacterium]MDW8390278.1 hypothetical protein [Oscillochloridaceae bacterium]
MGSSTGKKWLWRAALLIGGLWLAGATLLPGRVRQARLAAISGPGPFYATITWSYGLGVRPISIIFDLQLGDSYGSATTDGEALEAEIPLSAAPNGPCRITASATYRLFGFPYTQVRRFEEKEAGGAIQ